MLPGPRRQRTLQRGVQDQVQGLSEALPEHDRPPAGMHLRGGDHPSSRLQQSADLETTYQIRYQL